MPFMLATELFIGLAQGLGLCHPMKGGMSVTVDHQPLQAEKLGLRTVGQVLAHLQKDNRLVVHVLIDGQEPAGGHLTGTLFGVPFSLRRAVLRGGFSG